MLIWPFGNADRREAKEIILKEYFNSSKQKKAIRRAVNESAKDQRDMVAKYRELIRKK